MRTARPTAGRLLALAVSSGVVMLSGCNAPIGQGIGRGVGEAVLELFSRISICVAVGAALADGMVVSYLCAKDKQKARLQFWVPFALLGCVFLSGVWRFAFTDGVPLHQRLRWIFVVASIVFVFAVPIAELVARRGKGKDAHP